MSDATASLTRRTRNKVPEPTAIFWIIKILATTVGARQPPTSSTPP